MNSFIYMLYPKRYINSLEKKFKRLGSSNKIDINIFLITRLILEFILFILLYHNSTFFNGACVLMIFYNFSFSILPMTPEFIKVCSTHCTYSVVANIKYRFIFQKQHICNILCNFIFRFKSFS